MNQDFASQAHRERYLRLVMEDSMSPEDVERASLFYIISGNEELFRKRAFIYQPEQHRIRNCLENRGVDFSSGLRSLIRLGLNLYNGWSDGNTTPLGLFAGLDKNNLMLAHNALKIRFSRGIFNAAQAQGAAAADE